MSTPRTRSTIPPPTQKTLTNHYTQWAGTTGEPWKVVASYDNNILTTVRTYSNVMDDWVTPGFEKWRSRGMIFNNPMSKTTSEEVSVGGSLDMKFISYSTTTPRYYIGWGSSGTWLGGVQSTNRFLSVPSIDLASLKARAITKAYSNQKANDTLLLATMGELKETVTSISVIMRRAAKILWAVKRLNTRALRKEISDKELASRYMEARYALRPLAYDVSQTLAAFSNSATQKRFTARGSYSDSASVSDVAMTFSHPNYEIYASRSSMRTVEARCGVLACVDTLSKINIWGVDQVLSSAWELVPLSFVADWFFNIGKTIASWEPTVGLKSIASWIVTNDVAVQHSVIDHCVCKLPSTNIQERYMNYSGSTTKTVVVKTREVNPDLPVCPRLDVRLDGWKLLDLGIILKNILT